MPERNGKRGGGRERENETRRNYNKIVGQGQRERDNDRARERNRARDNVSYRVSQTVTHTHTQHTHTQRQHTLISQNNFWIVDTWSRSLAGLRTGRIALVDTQLRNRPARAGLLKMMRFCGKREKK